MEAKKTEYRKIWKNPNHHIHRQPFPFTKLRKPSPGSSGIIRRSTIRPPRRPKPTKPIPKEPAVYTPKQTRARTSLIQSTFSRTNQSVIEYLNEVVDTEGYKPKWLPEGVPLSQQYALLPSDDDMSDYEYLSPSESEEDADDTISISSIEALNE